ncbi:MAG: AraC family transcriptional regulator [Hespellia sp.]|nr:AraC family transcriptional regulator [Hespellia sp.]
MAIYLERPHLDEHFPLSMWLNEGDILTTPHWHKEHEILYVKRGTVRMGIGEKTLEVKEGEFLLVAGGRVHYVLASPGSIRYVYQFSDNLFRELLQDERALETLKNLWRDYPAHSREWKEDIAISTRGLLETIYEENKNQRCGYAYALKGYMCLLVFGLYQNKEYRGSEGRYEYHVESSQMLEKLDLIFQYVEEHYTQQITLEEIAEHIGFSTFYFTKFFKKNVGKTFVKFLNEYRIEKAKWILMNEDLGALELIERIGIGSTKTYYRLFKEIAGMSPREYKSKNGKDK